MKNFYVLIKYSILIFLTGLFVLQIFHICGLKIQGNFVYLLYVSYLINEHNFIPYKEVFEINLPSTQLYHILIGKIFGYSNFAIHIVNLIWLSLTLIVTFLIMKPFGNLVSILACLLFGNMYLASYDFILERDYILILPLILSIWLSLPGIFKHLNNYSFFLIGLLFGFIFFIKPFICVTLPLILLFNILVNNKNDFKIKMKSFLKALLVSCIGFSLITLSYIIWLWKIEALDAFSDILFSYIPLYAEFPYNMEISDKTIIIKGILIATIKNFKLMDIPITLSLIGMYFVVYNSRKNQRTLLSFLFIILLSFFFIIVSAINKGAPNYWIPFFYFACLASSLLFYSDGHLKKFNIAHLVPLILVIIVINNLFYRPSDRIYPFYISEYLKENLLRQDIISKYIKTNLQPGDKIQPLSWQAGMNEALLENKSVIATRFITDLQFYHHINNPYIINLRKEFINELTKAKPKYIIKVKPFDLFSRPGKSTDFSELENYISTNYIKDKAEGDVIFYKLKL